MDDVKFNCPHCQQHLEAPEELMGQVIDCPACNERIQLPQRKPVSPVTSLPPPLPQLVVPPEYAASQPAKISDRRSSNVEMLSDQKSTGVQKVLRYVFAAYLLGSALLCLILSQIGLPIIGLSILGIAVIAAMIAIPAMIRARTKVPLPLPAVPGDIKTACSSPSSILPPPLPHTHPTDLSKIADPTDVLRGKMALGGVLLLASVPTFVWSTQFNGFFCSNMSFSHDEILMARALRILGWLLIATGGFFIGGWRLASWVYRRIGLDLPITSAMKPITSLLQLSAAWNIAFAWGVAVLSVLSSGSILLIGIVLMSFYGYFPFVMAPFVARARPWALWTVSLLFSLQSLILILAYLRALLVISQGRASLDDILDIRLVYFGITCATAFLGWQAIVTTRRKAIQNG